VLSNVLRRAFRPRPTQVIAAVLVFAAVLLLVHFTTVNSEVYEFADGFVAQDGRITKLTGRQSERTLRWRKGFGMSYGDSSGEASLTMHVTGDQGTFDVPLVLQKKQGRWIVVGAKAVNEKGETVVIVE
jgi:hypothetical protein